MLRPLLAREVESRWSLGSLRWVHLGSELLLRQVQVLRFLLMSDTLEVT